VRAARIRVHQICADRGDAIRVDIRPAEGTTADSAEPQSKSWKRAGEPVQDLDGGAPFQPAKTASTTSAEPEEPPGLAA
jgi:hypothetical protein